MRPISIIALLVLIPISAFAQEFSSERKSEIVASFNKEKNVAKEKHGVRIEKYKKIVSEPANKPNIRDYSGFYEVEGFGYRINIQVGNDGSVNATGTEPTNGGTRSFRLAGAKIANAMLTATKVYDDRAKEKFEGVFLNRTDYISPTDPSVRTFGLGVIVNNPVEINGLTLDKLFYQWKQ
jgi:hypothetical protein